MTLPELTAILARSLALAAAVLACMRTRRDAVHRPVAVALTGACILDLVRVLGRGQLSPEVGLVLHLGTPALSAWAALAWSGTGPAWIVIVAWATTAARIIFDDIDSGTWTRIPRVVAIGCLAVQAGALLGAGPRVRSITGACLLVLAAGDLAALLGPLLWGGAWWPAQGQAAIVAVLVIAIHLYDFPGPQG